MERTLADIWQPVKGMHMRILGDNFFAFYFFHPVDMQRVLVDGPWFFVNHVMVLKAAEPRRQVCRDDLFEVPFWIQIYDLPPNRMPMASGRQIGVEMGHLLTLMPVMAMCGLMSIFEFEWVLMLGNHYDGE
ncbi:hypothetical protein SLE2022_265850 [Rubroshorea leprosula]